MTRLRVALRSIRDGMSGRRRFSAVIGAVVALVIGLGAGTAYAFFTSSGSGSGSAIGGTTQTVTVLQATGSVTNKLFPGTSGDLAVTLNNPNGAVTIVSIAQNGPVVVSGGSGCTSDSGTEPSLSLGNSGVSVPSQSSLNVSVSHGSNVNVIIPNGAAMTTGSNSGCQGATFQIPVSITVHEG